MVVSYEGQWLPRDNLERYSYEYEIGQPLMGPFPCTAIFSEDFSIGN
jgi:hypothetical protein